MEHQNDKSGLDHKQMQAPLLGRRCSIVVEHREHSELGHSVAKIQLAQQLLEFPPCIARILFQTQQTFGLEMIEN